MAYAGASHSIAFRFYLLPRGVAKFRGGGSLDTPIWSKCILFLLYRPSPREQIAVVCNASALRGSSRGISASLSEVYHLVLPVAPLQVEGHILRYANSRFHQICVATYQVNSSLSATKNLFTQQYTNICPRKTNKVSLNCPYRIP